VKIWVDRELVENSSAYLDDKNWPLGTGLFETMRTENGSVQFLTRHMRRVIASARVLKIPVPDENLISQAIDELLVATPHPVGRLRLSFSSERFVATHESYTAESNPFKIMVSQELSSTVGRQYKIFPYSGRLDLLNEATAAGCDELIQIDHNDRVCDPRKATVINGEDCDTDCCNTDCRPLQGAHLLFQDDDSSCDDNERIDEVTQRCFNNMAGIGGINVDDPIY
jgi:branched-subunit amino acid aminotransferase/4-amino-4-deoxychorismate lyase